MFYFTIEKFLNELFATVNEKYSINLKTKISYSDYDNFDYQSSSLFSISKHKSFELIVQDIIHSLSNNPCFEKVELTGKGFLSIKINPDLCLLQQPNFKDNFLETVIVDYCGVNVAKKMHIGHIRSMFIGEYISNQQELLGYNVVRVNHIGDWGNQFGYLLHYIYSNNLNVFSNEQLTDFYKKSYEQYSNDPIFANESNMVAQKLQNKEEPYFSLWKKCCEISINEMNQVTHDFNMKLTSSDIKGESFYADILPFVEQDLLSKSIIFKGDDNSIVFKNSKNIPIMLKKSNGSYLYAMYDLAAIFYRINTYNPNKIFYVVDKRQADHFKAVFEIAQKAQWSNKCQFKHIDFGFILGTDNKPLKTKKGEVLYLDKLIAEGFQELSQNSFYQNLPVGYKEDVISKTLFGSLKWFDLRSNYNTDYKFDWNNILNNDSGTASYVFHAYARTESIIFKNKDTELPDKLIVGHLPEAAINLFKKSKILDETLYLNTDTIAPNLIEEKLLDLVKSFHFFYEKINVSESKDKAMLIKLLESVSESIYKTCSLLGFEPYDAQIVWNKQKLLSKHLNV